MWDELDLWRSKLNELDSEVHDVVEQDPGQAQEWMDSLMVPFQQYQQVSQRAEARTSQLNKVRREWDGYTEHVVVSRGIEDKAKVSFPHSHTTGSGGHRGRRFRCWHRREV